MIITVVGQGYVGLPLAIAASKVYDKVYGYDTNQNKIDLLKKGESNIEDINNSQILSSLLTGKYVPTNNTECINASNIILICVPTPLTSKRKPDLSALIDATTTVGKFLKAGSLVIVESTIEPGTCRKVLYPILTRESGLDSNKVELAYSPERIDPTNSNWGIKNTKIISRSK
jgi:nucleotide sugar dehydrogenase